MQRDRRLQVFKLLAESVRSIGNIGAHMEKDINLIIDVEPEEAQALIELTETLFQEWYVGRHERQQRLARVAKIAGEKKSAISAGRAKAGKDAPEPERG
jgi:hypothetical protein